VRVLVEAGVEFITDDELLANPPYCPLEQRVQAIMRVINEHADRSGKQVLYAFNISGEIDDMRRYHDIVVEHGGNCVQVNINQVGVTGVTTLRHYSQVAIHARRTGWGLYTRAPLLGMEFRAYQKFWRLTGIDHLHVNGLQNNFWEPDDSVIAAIKDCLTPIFSADDVVLPVLSSGQWGGQLAETYRRSATADLLYIATEGILQHPAGPAAGVRAVRQAWDAARSGIPADEYARDHAELAQAIATFAPKQ
jgi:ribulose-bisphosphate carboxylase large chain